jgi:hypothetical protein
MKKLILIPIILFSISLFSQTKNISSQLEGVIKSKETSELLPFVNIVLFQNGEMVIGTQSDFDGNYRFNDLKPGTYTLNAASIGFRPISLSGIQIGSNETKFVGLKMGGKPMVIRCCYCFTAPKPDIPEDLITQQDSLDQAEAKELVSYGLELRPVSLGFVAYPNPAKNLVTLDRLPNTDQMLLLNLNGQILKTIYIHEDNQMTIEMGDLPNGVYLLRYLELGKQHVYKLIKH